MKDQHSTYIYKLLYIIFIFEMNYSVDKHDICCRMNAAVIATECDSSLQKAVQMNLHDE